MAAVAKVRPYRGIEASERIDQRRRRFLDAGLDLLGADDPDGVFTVRAVCRRSGLTARYFYESFTDKDEFVAAVFDAALADIAGTTQAAVAASPAPEQTRVRLSNPVILRKRADLGGVFAVLAGQHAESALHRDQNSRTRATINFMVGGVGQTLSAWLSGEIDLNQDQLIEQITAIIDELANPQLYRD